MSYRSAGYAMLLAMSAAAGCGPQGSPRSEGPAPQGGAAERSGKVFVTGSEPATGLTLMQSDGSGISLIGDLTPELRRLAGTTLRVQGVTRGEPPAGGFEVQSYEVLEVDGAVPEVGLLRADNGRLWLAGKDTVEIASPPDALREQSGAKVWIVGRRGENGLEVQSYGIIREAAR